MFGLKMKSFYRLLLGWNKWIDGNKMYRVIEKLKLLKNDFKSLHRGKYDRLADRVKEKRANLAGIQEQLLLDPLNETLICNEKVALKDFLILRKA